MKYEEIKEHFKLVEGILYRWGRKHGGDRWESRKKEWVKVKFSNDKDGYHCFGFNGKMVKAHRVLFCLYNQTDIPSNLEIDHLDGIKTDNSKENLRLVTKRQNNQNKDNHRKGHLVGTSFDKKARKWVSLIRINYKLTHLGIFTTQQEAHSCYLKAVELVDQFQNAKQFRELVKSSIT